MLKNTSHKTILLIGASRGLGLAMAEEFLKKGWSVVATVRNIEKCTRLHDLFDQYKGQLIIENVDICKPEQVASLFDRLSAKIFDMLFVNAGVNNKDPSQTIAEISSEEFITVFTTNALSPMRVIEHLAPLVRDTGLIGVMSSGQGSISNNETGDRELYRGSKAALNMFMRSFAARQAATKRALVAMVPGWVKTDMGGENALLTIEESIPNLVEVLIKKQNRPGLEYLDYQGRTVPW